MGPARPGDLRHRLKDASGRPGGRGARPRPWTRGGSVVVRARGRFWVAPGRVGSTPALPTMRDGSSASRPEESRDRIHSGEFGRARTERLPGCAKDSRLKARSWQEVGGSNPPCPTVLRGVSSGAADREEFVRAACGLIEGSPGAGLESGLAGDGGSNPSRPHLRS